MGKPYRFIKTILAVSIGLALPATSFAEIEKIVVTAQKRTESIMEVPIAITAFSDETLEKLGITEASQLIEVTPGLGAISQSGSNRNYFLRGVGTQDFHLTAASAIGQYYDGITLTSGFHARAALFDMERVEILKGPQNTLFGLNTTGGAINYISKKPDIGGGTNGHVSVKLGTDSLVKLDGAVGFDVMEDVAARIAIQTNKHDGPFTSLSDGKDYGDDDMKAYRLGIAWEPSAEASLLLNVHGMESNNNGSAVRALGTRNPDGSGDVCADFKPGILDFGVDTNCISRDGANTGEPATDPSTGDWSTITQNFGYEDVSTFGYYLNFEYDLEWASLNFITSWDNLEVQSAIDFDGGPTLGLHLMQGDDRDTTQHELRLVSSGDNSFRWITGVYYLDEEADSYTGARSPHIGFGRGNKLPNVQLSHTKENLGIYFQGEYDLTEALTLTAGVRWSDEEIVADYKPSSPDVTGLSTLVPLFTSDIDTLVAAQFIGNDGFDANGYEIARQVQQKLPNEDVGYTVKLDWKVSDDSMLYASTSKGFKGSAADIRAVYALRPIGQIEQGLEESRLAPESLLAYEIGYKSSFLDNSLVLDTAVFMYEYSDLQQFVTSGGVPTLVNAPESEMSGLDANLKYSNNDGYYIDLGLTLLDTEIVDATGSPLLQGSSLANSPDLSMNLIAAKDFEMSDGSLLSMMANVNYTGEQLLSNITTANTLTIGARTEPSRTMLNANLTYHFGKEQQFTLSLQGNNLTNKEFCGGKGMNEANRVYEDGVGAASFHYNITCRVTRASTRTFAISFGYEFY